MNLLRNSAVEAVMKFETPDPQVLRDLGKDLHPAPTNGVMVDCPCCSKKIDQASLAWMLNGSPSSS